MPEEKPLGARERTNNQATLMGGECFHHCATLAPHFDSDEDFCNDAETSVDVTNRPIQDYTHPHDHIHHIFIWSRIRKSLIDRKLTVLCHP